MRQSKLEARQALEAAIGKNNAQLAIEGQKLMGVLSYFKTNLEDELHTSEAPLSDVIQNYIKGSPANHPLREIFNGVDTVGKLLSTVDEHLDKTNNEVLALLGNDDDNLALLKNYHNAALHAALGAFAHSKNRPII